MGVCTSCRLLDVVWPRNCEVCGRPVDRPSRYICAECLNRIPFVRPEDGIYEILDVASAVRFECETRQMILGYKFERHLWLRDDFVDWMEAAANSRFDVSAVDLVIPMPTTVLHRMDRGYNPCELLASELAKRISRVCRTIVVRKGNFKRQGSLTEEERMENVKGTFEVRSPEFVRGRTALVVDDIMTTGATLGECASTLKQAGASRVWSVTLARSVRS
jgi:ComF family protein